MPNFENYDYSTLNVDRLKKLPVYKLPASYELQRDPGNFCFGDPPGYPTYFTRSVYTRFGNSPSKGVETVILFGGVLYAVANVQDTGGRNNTLRRLWSPLPIDHPRTRAWILSNYKHLQHCYFNPVTPDATVIWPVPNCELHSFTDDLRFNDEWREAKKNAIRLRNTNIIESRRLIAIPQNHQAVVSIRRYYPYQPELDLIDAPPARYTGDWWERYAENFSPATCPGIHGRQHASATWCQMCGWYAEEK